MIPSNETHRPHKYLHTISTNICYIGYSPVNSAENVFAFPYEQVLTNDQAMADYGEDFLFGLSHKDENSLRPAVFIHWILFISVSVVPGYLISGKF